MSAKSGVEDKKIVNIRDLGGEIWGAIEFERLRARLEVKQEAFNRIIDVAMAVTARHKGKVLIDDDEFPVDPWPLDSLLVTGMNVNTLAKNAEKKNGDERPAHQNLLYVLCHSYTVNEGDPDHEETETKELYYSFSPQSCMDQIGCYANLEGFKDYPDGFEVMHIELEQKYWESGFIRW